MRSTCCGWSKPSRVRALAVVVLCFLPDIAVWLPDALIALVRQGDLSRWSSTTRMPTSKVVRISLNPSAKRLLARSHKLRVTLLVFLRTQKVATRTLTFKSKKMH